jgi:hypothetical protein
MCASKLPESPTFHPLMQPLQRPVTRRAIVLGASTAIAAGVTQVSAAQDDRATPDVQIAGDEEAVAILERAAKVLAEFQTFAFELETTRGSSTIFQGFELESVEGVVRRPTDLQAQVRIGTPLGSLSVSAVSLDGSLYIQDPLSDGGWMELGQMGEVASLINPDMLILSAVRLVQDATVTGTEKVDGVETTVIEGKVDVSGLLGQMEADAAQFLAEGPIDVLFWIDGEDRVVEVEMLGPIFASESEDIVRVISIFDVNEPVEIEKPQGISTPEM